MQALHSIFYLLPGEERNSFEKRESALRALVRLRGQAKSIVKKFEEKRSEARNKAARDQMKEAIRKIIRKFRVTDMDDFLEIVKEELAVEEVMNA